VRGHLARVRNEDYRDCCMCLAHRFCTLSTDVGMMCRECAKDGPHADLTGCDDPWDWFRNDYKDLTYRAEPRGERRRLKPFPTRRRHCEWEEEDERPCKWCGTTFKRLSWGPWRSGPNELGYCSNNCDQLYYCWWRMKQAGVRHKYPDLEWFATWS